MSEQILLRLTSIVVLGVATQWVAWRLRLPGILLLLLVGFAVGPGTEWLARHGILSGQFLAPNVLFGDLLLPAVSLSVALILFEGGLTLRLRELSSVGPVIWRLSSVGAAITWGAATLGARFILGVDWPVALLLGSILMVTGPTVIGPMLRHVKPFGQVGPVLKWEGIVIDPIGAMVAVLMFEVISAGHFAVGNVSLTVLSTLLCATIVGLGAAGIVILMLRRHWAPDFLHSPITLMLALAAFEAANLVRHESGLFAVILMGIVLANQRLARVRHIMEFKETLTVLLISALFIVLGARLELGQIAMIGWSSLAFIVFLIMIVRPLVTAICTLGSNLNVRERVFIAAMAPRGIVAAAVSSVFALRLRAEGMPGANELVPQTFAVIIGTVTVYGLVAPWIARKLGLSRPGASGFLVVGANRAARTISQAIHAEGYEVLLVDTNPHNVQAARLAGLPVVFGSINSQDVTERVELSSIGRLLALTPNEEVNSLAATHYGRIFGREEVFQLPAKMQGAAGEKVAAELRGRTLFGNGITYDELEDRLEHGSVVKKTSITTEFTYEQYRRANPDAVVLMVIARASGVLTVITDEHSAAPGPGSNVLALVNAAVPVPA